MTSLAIDEPSATILVVDDDKAVRMSFASYLEDCGYHVAQVAGGSDALAAIERKIFDLVLLDLRMPDIDGFTVLASMQQSHPDLPVIIVSGTGKVGDVVQALRLGARNYLTKPIENLEVLGHSVRESIHKARLIKQSMDYQSQLEHEVAERTRELRELSMHMEGIREQEKRRIAQEIHDELGVTLTALNTEISLLGKALARGMPDLEMRTISMKSLVTEALDTSRRIISDLRPSILDTLGLVAALEWQGKEFSKRYGILLRFGSDREEIELEEGKTIALFRVFQEALTNVAKHAEATSVDVRFTVEPESARLQLRDNGVGFDTGLDHPSSHGIRGMRERIKNLGGRFGLYSEPNRGTQLIVEIPI